MFCIKPYARSHTEDGGGGIATPEFGFSILQYIDMYRGLLSSDDLGRPTASLKDESPIQLVVPLIYKDLLSLLNERNDRTRKEWKFLKKCLA